MTAPLPMLASFQSQLRMVIQRSPLRLLSDRARLYITVIFWVLVALMIIQPIKMYAWNTIKANGDDALAARNFSLAHTEYTKLRLINAFSDQPKELLKQVDDAQADIFTLRSFYAKRHDTTMLALFDQAQADYPSPQAATLACQDLFSKTEAHLALVCITKTTATWPTYRDAWISQSLFAQAIGDSTLAQEARNKATLLDPSITF